MHTLVIPCLLFRQILSDLRHAPEHTGWGRVGESRLGADITWLARDVIREHPRHANASVMSEPLWEFRLVTHPPAAADARRFPRLSTVVGTLWIGAGPMRGAVWGAVHLDEHSVPLQELYLVGAGMYRLTLAPSQDVHPGAAPRHALQQSTRDQRLDPTIMRSRTMGALGGEAVWQRLAGLRVAIIGVGRTGSIVAITLAQTGLRDIILIDPDRIAPHNLGEMMAMGWADVGRYKVEAVAEALQEVAQKQDGYPVSSYATLPVPITADAARTACTQADVLICCADHNTSRVTVGHLAAWYHKVLLDIGTGTFFHASPEEGASRPDRTQGMDIRLILPGDGCLLCWGNAADLAQTVDDLAHNRPFGRQQAWHEERAGSLLALNQTAAGRGISMLQDLVGERIHVSTWEQIAIDAHGKLLSPAYPPRREEPCRLCSRAGLGDAALG